MAWTDAETTRVRNIELAINDLATAISNLMSKQQYRQLLLLKQNEVDALTTRVADLETQVAVLQGQIDS